MFEKVNPAHPDKIADRIAGALVDAAYAAQENPKIAVEVLIGHGECNIVAETSVWFDYGFVRQTVERIAGEDMNVNFRQYKQDAHLAENQSDGIVCGDNGIFCGMPVTNEERELTDFAGMLYLQYPCDGKYILSYDIHNGGELIVCQSNAMKENLDEIISSIIERHIPTMKHVNVRANPIGYWTGGTGVDTGATNRKLGSDMGRSVTGGGLHGKDLSKADVAINIYLWQKAQTYQDVFDCRCGIGDKSAYVARCRDSSGEWVEYKDIVESARKYIKTVGGFEKFAKWGLLNPGERW